MTGRRIPAGWYDDPAGSGGLRWFDGAAWTTQVQPPGTSIPVDEPAVAVGPPVSTSVGPVATVAREEQETATSASDATQHGAGPLSFAPTAHGPEITLPN